LELALPAEVKGLSELTIQAKLPDGLGQQGEPYSLLLRGSLRFSITFLNIDDLPGKRDFLRGSSEKRVGVCFDQEQFHAPVH
jgi:hypothetical protein